MTVYVPGTNTGPFGGPVGDTQDSIKMIMQGILQGQAKRKQEGQNKLLSDMFSRGGVGDDPAAQSEYEKNPSVFVDKILSNPKLLQETKDRAVNILSAKSRMGLESAHAENLRAPKASKNIVIKYWEPDGTPGELMSSEENYNTNVKKLKDAGYRVGEKPAETWSDPTKVGSKWIQKNEATGQVKEAYSSPDGWSKPYLDEDGNRVQENRDTGEIKVVNKPDKEQAGEFERLINKLDKAGNITPEKKNDLISQRVKKLIETGKDSDETNKIILGDGQKVTLAELRAQYREKYNIPDEFQLGMMEINPDPLVRQQAIRLKAEAATKPSFVEFMMDAKKKGLEGIRPGGVVQPKPKPTTPPLPPGFKLD